MIKSYHTISNSTYSQCPVRLADGLSGWSLPQLGPYEGVEVGQKPLGTDGLQQVGNELIALQRLSVLHGNVLVKV